ncbi:hypothetical protein Lfu02_44380 [Longispora fulva]|uniref:Uncharacterized protein n=1 Tax=Longispora fulva TaxID=619741 RepID=A0A8J7GH09_9ACTN|nr:class I SAM-dependent methyltransferase [Longispora fulva]MBG6136895.1 hypothetical protein [Longispora fulva]GIG60066.1 hypothetical protein Lfu02_44380 [Longispora fulva]
MPTQAPPRGSNGTLAAARRWCEVTSTDYVPRLLAGSLGRAQAEGLDVLLQQADAKNLSLRRSPPWTPSGRSRSPAT